MLVAGNKLHACTALRFSSLSYEKKVISAQNTRTNHTGTKEGDQDIQKKRIIFYCILLSILILEKLSFPLKKSLYSIEKL